MARFIEEEKAEQVMKEIGAMEESIPIMLPKCSHRLIRLEKVRNSIANIVKQEMLALGGDAAVNKGTVNCTVPETDVLLMGTLKQYKLFVEKMEKQVSECPEVAEEVKKLLEEK